MNTCDCGQPASHKDGSGYSCSACHEIVMAAQAMLAEVIRRQRHEEVAGEQLDARREYYRGYRDRNRAAITAYQKQYQKELCKSET